MQTVSGRKVNADSLRKAGKCRQPKERKVNADSFTKEDKYTRFQEGR